VGKPSAVAYIECVEKGQVTRMIESHIKKKNLIFLMFSHKETTKIEGEKKNHGFGKY
jgi:hypothetical protein